MQSASTSTRGRYKKKYKLDDLERAYRKVICDKVSVLRASKQCNVPLSTLRDKLKLKPGETPRKTSKSGGFTSKDEKFMAEHINTMRKIGYRYTLSEVLDRASEYAVHLGHKDKNQLQSYVWLQCFVQRHPLLKIQKRKASVSATNKEISSYFMKLKAIMDMKGLKKSPQSVYMVNAKTLLTEASTWKMVATGSDKSQMEETTTVTMISAFSATGTSVPPYFIFPGKRMQDEILSGATPGVHGTMNKTGECNSDIFSDYIKYHLLKFVPAHSVASPILVLYDGYKNHVTLPLLAWACDNHVILFPLPHNCNGQLPLDGGCSDSFESRWSDACCNHVLGNNKEDIAASDICRFACEIHSSTMTPANVMSSFKRSGIYPLTRVEISVSKVVQKSDHGSTVSLGSDKAVVSSQSEPVSKDVQKSAHSSTVSLHSDKAFLQSQSEPVSKDVQKSAHGTTVNLHSVKAFLPTQSEPVSKDVQMSAHGTTVSLHSDKAFLPTQSEPVSKDVQKSAHGTTVSLHSDKAFLPSQSEPVSKDDQASSQGSTVFLHSDEAFLAPKAEHVAQDFQQSAQGSTIFLHSDAAFLASQAEQVSEDIFTVKIKEEPLDTLPVDHGDWEGNNWKSCSRFVKVKEEPSDQIQNAQGNKRKHCPTGVQVYDSDSELTKIREDRGPSRVENKVKRERVQ